MLRFRRRDCLPRGSESSRGLEGLRDVKKVQGALLKEVPSFAERRFLDPPVVSLGIPFYDNIATRNHQQHVLLGLRGIQPLGVFFQAVGCVVPRPRCRFKEPRFCWQSAAQAMEPISTTPPIPPYPQGPSTQYLRTLIIPLMVLGPESLIHWVLGCSGIYSTAPNVNQIGLHQGFSEASWGVLGRVICKSPNS